MRSLPCRVLYFEVYISRIAFTNDNKPNDVKVGSFLEQNVEILTKELNEYKNPHEELLRKCRQANLSKRDTEIAIKYYYDHNTPKEIWLWIIQNKEYEPIEWDSVHQLLWRIGKKLNK